MRNSEKDLVRAVKTVRDELAKVSGSTSADGMKAYKKGLTAGAY